MKIWTLLAFVSFFILPQLQSQTPLVQELTQKWQNAAEYTLEVAKAMPADKYDFRPTSEVMRFGEQLLHMTVNMNWLGNQYLGATPHSISEFEDITKKETIIKILEEGLENAREAMTNITAEELDETVEFFAGPMTKRQIIHLMHDHFTHHRGQLVVYLRLNGITPPRYVGW